MFRTGLLVVCVVLAASTFTEAASRQVRGRTVAKRSPKIVISGPQNDAFYDSSTVTLSCQTTPGDRTQWIEYMTTPFGGIISDNGTVSPGHPYNARYTMVNDFDNGWYNLTISPTWLADGGRYRCLDENTYDYKDAEIVILKRATDCTNTIPANNVIILGVYYTITCVITYGASEYIAPSTTWTGPGDFNFGSANGTDTNGTKVLQSAVQFIAQKAMDGNRYTMRVFFEQRYFGQAPDTATNTPALTFNVNGPFMFVQYAPWNISYVPVKPSYEIGEVLTCYADAVPLPTYQWTNMQTGDQYASQTLVLTAAMVGTYTFRCQVANTWGTQNIFANITTNPITTPTTPTTPTTTTPIPAVQNCNDLTGKWITTRPDGTQAVLCLYVDTTRNGAIGGFLQNNTQLGNLIELIGNTRNGIFDETGLVGIWPGDTGVSSIAAECHNCYGVESFVVTVISRTELDDIACGDGGALRNSEQYTFGRTAFDTGAGFCYSP